MASLKFVREVATSISEPLKEHFTRGTDAAMVVLSPAGEATNHAPDLAVGPLIRELAVNYEGKSASKDFLSTCNEGEPSENTSSGTDCDDVLVLKRKLKSLKRKYRQLKESMMRNEIVSAPDHFHEENSRRFTSSIKDLANVFVKLIPFKRRMDPKASPVKDEANVKEGEDISNHNSVKCSQSESKIQYDESTVKSFLWIALKDRKLM